MSENITTAMKAQYTDDFQLLSQQKGSKLEPYIWWDDVQAQKGYVDQIGATSGQEKRSRNEDTRFSNPEHDRVQITPVPWYDAVLVDKTDIPRIVADPKNKYKLNQVYAAGRWTDTKILEAALGTAKTGVAGGTDTDFDDTNNVVAVASSGLSVAKLHSAREIFYGYYDVDRDIPLHCALTEYQVQDLLAETKVGSVDYNSLKPLVDGVVTRFMGFQFHPLSTSIVATDSNDYRRVVCWAEDGLFGGRVSPVTTTMDRVPLKVNSIAIITEQDAGFTRVEASKVVEIKCSEA